MKDPLDSALAEQSGNVQWARDEAKDEVLQSEVAGVSPGSDVASDKRGWFFWEPLSALKIFKL